MARESGAALRSSNDVIHANLEMLVSGKFSDFTIHCDKQKFLVHRVMIYGKSSFYDALIDGSFKESIQHEAHLPIDEASVIAAVLYWMYTGNYPIPIVAHHRQKKAQETLCHPVENSILPTLTQGRQVLLARNFTSHLKLYEVADRQMLTGLKYAAFMGLKVLYQRSNGVDWKTSSDFINATAMVYDDSDACKDLKDFLLWAVVRDVEEDSEKWSTLSPVATQIHGFGWDLFLEHEKNISGFNCVSCGNKSSYLRGIQKIVLDKGRKYFEWVNCCCRFRGFCEDLCKVIDSTEDPTGYCDSCYNLYEEEGEHMICDLEKDQDGNLRLREAISCTISDYDITGLCNDTLKTT